MSFIEKTNKKRSLLTIISGLVFVLIILAGLFLNNQLGDFLLICMVLGMAISPFLGRFWCNWLCPRGSFLDYFVSKISRNKKFPPIFKRIYFKLAVLFIFMSAMGLNIYFLSRQYPLLTVLGITFLRLLIISTIVSITVGLIYQSRTWCVFCPGALFIKLAAFFKNKLPHLLIDKKICNNCAKCERVCPMQIASYHYPAIVTDNDCLKCGLCVKNCPVKALTLDGGK